MDFFLKKTKTPNTYAIITDKTNTIGNLDRFKNINYTILQENKIEQDNNSHRNYQNINKKLSSIEESADSSSEEENFNFSNMVKGEYNMRQEFEKSYEELVESRDRMKKFKIFIVAIIITVLVAAIISIAVILLNTRVTKPTDNLNGLELDDVLYGKLQARPFNGTWSSNNTIIYKDIDNGGIYEYDVATKKRHSLAIASDERIINAVQYEKSADGKYLLISRNYNMIFRHSFTAYYDVIDLQTGEIIPVKVKDTDEQEQLLFAKWSPEGNALLINFDRNLYYKTSVKDSILYQLTNDKESTIINGHPDWVYEEEVFASNTAFAFNPSGTKLAYIQFDDSPVHTMPIPFYGTPGSVNYQYPLTRTISYPKAGTPNPFVKLIQIDLKRVMVGDLTKILVPVPSALNTEAHLITAIEWLTDDILLSVWMNRIQNRAYIQTSTGSSRSEVFNVESMTGWVDLSTAPLKNKNGSHIALVLPQRQGSDGNYRHLTLISTKNSPINKPIVLTNGNYVVQKPLFWNYDMNTIFYMANQPNKSNVNHLYAIRAEKGDKPKCLTCNFRIDGVPQTFFTADFSTNGKFMVLSSLGPGIPRSEVYQVSFNNNNIDLYLITSWNLNNHIRKYLLNKRLPEIEHHSIDIGNGFTAKVSLQLPPNIDRSGYIKYPALVNVYGGPDDLSVNDKWNVDWGTYLSSNRSIIYIKIDGRGSGAQGDKMLHSIYKRLGTYEVYDQINVTRILQKQFPFIDANRTGIWGWSYGGYVSAMALAHDKSNVFKCGVSVAPVTDWTYYDSIYTERYMDLPLNNPTGYVNSRLSTLGPKFKGKMFLVVHGTLDDNVHYQQAMMLVKNLEHNDILFKQISYPDEDHALQGVSRHLYHSLDRFFDQCFQIKK